MIEKESPKRFESGFGVLTLPRISSKIDVATVWILKKKFQKVPFRNRRWRTGGRTTAFRFLSGHRDVGGLQAAISVLLFSHSDARSNQRPDPCPGVTMSAHLSMPKSTSPASAAASQRPRSAITPTEMRQMCAQTRRAKSARWIRPDGVAPMRLIHAWFSSLSGVAVSVVLKAWRLASGNTVAREAGRIERERGWPNGADGKRIRGRSGRAED